MNINKSRPSHIKINRVIIIKKNIIPIIQIIPNIIREKRGRPFNSTPNARMDNQSISQHKRTCSIHQESQVTRIRPKGRLKKLPSSHRQASHMRVKIHIKHVPVPNRFKIGINQLLSKRPGELVNRVNVIMVPGKRVKRSQLSPPGAELQVRVPLEAADISADHRDGEHAEVENPDNGVLKEVPLRVVVPEPGEAHWPCPAKVLRDTMKGLVFWPMYHWDVALLSRYPYKEW